MIATLSKRWQACTPRERMVLTWGAAILAAALYLWLLQSASEARTKLTTAVTTLRTNAARLELHASEVERLRTLQLAPAASIELRTLVQNQADAAGLSRALLGITVVDTSQVQVAFGSVAFADWLRWIDSLHKQQVRLDTCRIEALSTAGLISVTATLVRTRSQ